jgi:hypothetical protein
MTSASMVSVCMVNRSCKASCHFWPLELTNGFPKGDPQYYVFTNMV